MAGLVEPHSQDLTGLGKVALPSDLGVQSFLSSGVLFWCALRAAGDTFFSWLFLAV